MVDGSLFNRKFFLLPSNGADTLALVHSTQSDNYYQWISQKVILKSDLRFSKIVHCMTSQIATKRATPYMIPRIHQFWPHSYPRHQRRQSQRSSSEVGKSPLASTHIGDQLVLTPHDDKFPPPRRKNLSAVAPSRDPKANHTQRQYKSSIPNRFDIFYTKGFFTSSIIIHETEI